MSSLSDDHTVYIHCLVTKGNKWFPDKDAHCRYSFTSVSFSRTNGHALDAGLGRPDVRSKGAFRA
jgi:hypothetical protein